METRTRSVVDPPELRTVMFYPNPEVTVAAGGRVLEPKSHDFVVPEYIRSFEEMTPNSEGSHHIWKPFEHYKVQRLKPNVKVKLNVKTFEWEPNIWYYADLDGELPWAYYGRLPGGIVHAYGDPGRPVYGLPAFYEKRHDGGFVPHPADYDKLNEHALRHLLPHIKAELSLVNSLIELKDFATLPEQIREIKRFVEKTTRSRFLTSSLAAIGYGLNTIFKRRRSPKATATLREAARLTAGGYLQWKFNLSPLISDIAGIHTAITQWSKRVSDLITRAGRNRAKHFSFKWQEFPRTFEEFDNIEWFVEEDYLLEPCQRYRLSRFVLAEPSAFHAEIQYNANYTAFQLEHARVLTLLDSLGVNLNPQIIWNAIPWSFVVDWVLSVGKWLSQFQIQNMEPQINITRYLTSVKRERRVTVRREIVNELSQNVTGKKPKVPLPTVLETSYRRSVELPGRSLIESSGLNSTEFTLGAALVISRRKHSRHRMRV